MRSNGEIRCRLSIAGHWTSNQGILLAAVGPFKTRLSHKLSRVVCNSMRWIYLDFHLVVVMDLVFTCPALNIMFLSRSHASHGIREWWADKYVVRSHLCAVEGPVAVFNPSYTLVQKLAYETSRTAFNLQFRRVVSILC